MSRIACRIKSKSLWMTCKVCRLSPAYFLIFISVTHSSYTLYSMLNHSWFPKYFMPFSNSISLWVLFIFLEMPSFSLFFFKLSLIIASLDTSPLKVLRKVGFGVQHRISRSPCGPSWAWRTYVSPFYPLHIFITTLSILCSNHFYISLLNYIFWIFRPWHFAYWIVGTQ